MIKSMTGYGKALCFPENKKVSVEIKSVNGKQLDVRVKGPGMYTEKEMWVRSYMQQNLERGTVEVYMNAENNGEASNCQINQALALRYINDLKHLAQESGVSDNEILRTAVLMPEVLKTERAVLTEQEWAEIEKAIISAVESLNEFRIQEGAKLENDLIQRISLIEQYLKEIETFETGRIDNIRQRIKRELEDLISDASYDNSRFEQELIYYIEKLDITEEKVRLISHCEYFKDVMANESSQGRKLAFISQEIGREINTIGSKANDLNIQRFVVQMKDELEKIKEQINNIL